jgi:hypothetical protein
MLPIKCGLALRFASERGVAYATSRGFCSLDTRIGAARDARRRSLVGQLRGPTFRGPRYFSVCCDGSL